MILITGGLGFIGAHTTRALLDLGADCVAVQRGARPATAFEVELGKRVFVEQADIRDRDRLRALCERYRPTAIVHLAGSVPWPPGGADPVADALAAVESLLRVLDVARERSIRVAVASTIGVYGGIADPGPWHEDLPLAPRALHPIPAFKKIGELLSDHLADTAGLDVVNLRIAGIWGPGGHPVSRFMAAPQLLHAAAHGTAPELTGPLYADDGIDLCYVKDCARAIALLATAERLHHRVYNIGGGRHTTNAEVVHALTELVPRFAVEIRPGHGPQPTSGTEYLAIDRLVADTGYRPHYPVSSAAADYLAWLRAGNPR
ncbi:NAD-dependent epimerase/dehydratase family protein [Nocardia stercoris]|uniref:NAD(P)-dependent oxidoreductase n=1 Tax=Nocardia stercoris TaxID=2483361 RepID=A0A3M2L9I6_9NOCA|nr:NAD(P)-dependent oxidoreductase [Nocardia stercoris]RMI33380.1 NAD(P)-dependent oxidoreductase [Nocardia stercoris]